MTCDLKTFARSQADTCFLCRLYATGEEYKTYAEDEVAPESARRDHVELHKATEISRKKTIAELNPKKTSP